MITALDHFVLVCPDLEAAVADYTVLLGMDPAWRATSDGVGTAMFDEHLSDHLNDQYKQR